MNLLGTVKGACPKKVKKKNHCTRGLALMLLWFGLRLLGLRLRLLWLRPGAEAPRVRVMAARARIDSASVRLSVSVDPTSSTRVGIDATIHIIR